MRRSRSRPPFSSRSAIAIAFAAVVDEELIAAEPVATGALAGMSEGRGADEGPVQVLDAAVVVEGLGVGDRITSRRQLRGLTFDGARQSPVPDR